MHDIVYLVQKKKCFTKQINISMNKVNSVLH